MGKPFMPWQRYVADVALEIDENGRFAYQLVIVTVPRQSGKTTLFGCVLDQRALVIPNARAWFTMQTQKDAVDWLTNEHWPLLAPFGPAVQLRRMAGSEHIRWRPSDGLIRPFPPNPAGLHGKTSDIVVTDECWSFDPVRGQQIDQAIVPTQATRPNAQVWKLSTAGDANAIWWLGTVEAGRMAAEDGRTDGVAYFDWSCPDDLDPTNEASWPVYHPAYGRTIGREAMVAALAMLGADDFARAYGNKWVAMVARVIPLDAWREAQDGNAPMPEAGNVALGFDVAIDRADGAVAAAWRTPDGTARVEMAEARPGVGWLVPRLAELRAKWRPRSVGYDMAGPALDVADVLGRQGQPVDGVKGRDYAAACSGFLDALTERTVRVRPHTALDAAASGAARRPVGDAWVWGRRQSAVSIAALTAATVALWAYDHAAAPVGDFRVY
jgi:phage terminase large subunit-like protein